MKCPKCGAIPGKHHSPECPYGFGSLMPMEPPAPWQPMTEAKTVAVIGKIMEEAGELQAALARCLIQGIDEQEPRTGKFNREWLEDELGDVCGNIQIVFEFFKLDVERIGERAKMKMAHLKQWHDKL